MKLITYIIKFTHLSKDFSKNLIILFSLISNIIYNSFSELIEFCQLMMSEIIIPRKEYKREKKEARMNYRDHRRIIRHEHFSKKYHIVEQYVHKAITLVSLFISFCSFIVAFCMCYIVLWKWPHEYKPCKLPSGSLAGTKINGVILDVPPMKQPVYTSTDESFLDFIIRWFKSIFIANYTHEKYTGGKIVVIPRAKYEAMMRKKEAQQNKNSGKKKAFLDDLLFIDSSDLSWFLILYYLLNSSNFFCDYVIYFNINYLFTDVINYIC